MFDAEMEEKSIEEEAQQFVDYMMMPSSSRPLSWKSPTKKNSLWVFWTEEKAYNHASTSSDHQISIQDRIKTALFGFKKNYGRIPLDILVQFWAATNTMTNEGVARRLLTKADQPFALNRLTNEKLNRYKKDCPNYKLVGEEDNLTDGSICRVFRTQWPEMSADISCYSLKEYPERDLALGYDIYSTFTFPLFEPFLRSCVGVLELLFTENTNSLAIENDIYWIIKAIQGSGLQTVDPWSRIKYTPKLNFIQKEELKGAMDQVCETHGLPLVSIWTRGSLNSGEEILFTFPEIEAYDGKSVVYNDFIESAPCFPLRVGQGPVGKVFYSDKPCFCRDITQLSIIDHPMAHSEYFSVLESCFFVCIQSVAPGNRAYALELFLPQDKIHTGDLHNFLSSILTTLKQHLKSFEVVAGGIGNDFFTEIDSLTQFNVEASMLEGKNAILLEEQGNTFSTHNTFNKKIAEMEKRLKEAQQFAEMEKKRLEEAEQFAGMEGKWLEELKKIVDHPMPNCLSWRSPRTRRKGDLWVFWTENKASIHTSTSSDQIKTALFDCDQFPFADDVLVQFWAIMTDEGGRRVLTTADQPFALNFLTNENLNQYKRIRLNYKLVDEGQEEHNLTDGSICRVFRRQLPEMSADVSFYSVNEYPERDLALGCGIKSTLALPVFEPSLQGCVGVLELLFTKDASFKFGLYVYYAISRLQKAGLETVKPWQEYFLLEDEEIKRAMVQVREKHHLPLANVWGRCKNISSLDNRGSFNRNYNASDVNCRGELLVSLHEMGAYDPQGPNYYDLLELTLPHPLRVGYGPVGKAFHSDKPCFCRDVTQLSLIDYPMAHIARWAGFKSCFSVCLQSIPFGICVYALEFFLPPDNRHVADLRNFLSSILTTLKQNLKSFKVVIEVIGDEFFTEIDNLTESNMVASTVKGKNVIPAEHGNTYSTHNTLNKSSGRETASVSSGHETVPSIPLPLAFAYKQISILTPKVEYMQAEIAQFQKLVDEYEASCRRSV